MELRLEEGTPPIPATIVPLPPSMPFDFDLFFASNDADMQATAIALDARGARLTHEAPSPNISPTHPTPMTSDEIWRSGELRLRVTYDGATCLRIGPYDFERCVDGMLADLAPILQVDPIDDLSEPAFLLWGVVPSSVAELEIRAADYDRIPTDITHPAHEGVEFVVYLAPRSGDRCDLGVGFLDEHGRSMKLDPRLTCTADSPD